MKQQYDRAIEDYTRAIELKPNDAEIRYNLSLAFIARQQRGRVIMAFHKVVEIN
jgi:tetratricopeptide (TPR) repeat protein